MIEATTKKENLVPTLAKDESLQREEKPLFFYHSNFSTPYKKVHLAWQQFLVDLMNTHCLYRFLDGQKIPASNLAFQAFKGFIGT